MTSHKRALVIHPWLKGRTDGAVRSPEASLEEAVRLGHAIDLEVVDTVIVAMSNIKPSTLIGSGKVEEIKARVEAAAAGLVIVNHTVSPVQQRNLEKAWNCKVIDRTALILEIFGARARTHEGKLQVELAALEYQKSRLVRSWTHLERQRGGFGFLGGPGESQIEIDRRLIRDRISKIKKQLEDVTRTRNLHRKVRRDVPYPVVALVGYTNAGKSTLFNRLTGANVLSMDKLFATLDPTMRSCVLPGGTKIILSDTVGFVSDLPTQLVAAFRATLEEVLEADVLLHVRDISYPDSEAQKQDVEQVLRSLFVQDTLPENLVEVHNKIDLLEHGSEAKPDVIRVSAHTGEGIDALLKIVEALLAKQFYTEVSYQLRLDDGKALAWLHAHGKVVEQTVEDEYIQVIVQLAPDNIARFDRIHHAKSS
ncbi:MAG: GTPase HflX [Alphaproteobacteria bacterium]